MKEFSLSPTSMGAVFSAFLISYTLLMTPGGRWSDRFGPRNMLAITALGSGLLTALVPLGGTPGLGSLIGVIPGCLSSASASASSPRRSTRLRLE